MAGITKDEFLKIYEEQMVPVLKPLEEERLVVCQKTRPFKIIGIIAIIVFILGCIINCWLSLFAFIVGLPCFIYIYILWAEIRDKLKKDIISKLVSLCGNLYFSQGKEVITSSEISDMGLFPSFTRKYDDDVIVGIHKGCNFALQETRLEHTEGSGKSSHTVTDFSGLIVKIQMNKNFSGKTIAGTKWEIEKLSGFEEVKLEDVEFMKDMKVYSTDQIEARYILTTAFMERLYQLGESFSNNRAAAKSNMSKSQTAPQGHLVTANSRKQGFLEGLLGKENLVSAAFIDGYVYLFIPKNEDFFEIDTSSTLLDSRKYYDVYCQIQLILSIVSYLKLDMKLGL
jgi:hypothetical protein